MTFRKLTPTAMAAACALICCGTALADDSAFRFSGFGTVGFVGTDTDEAGFTTPGQPASTATHIAGATSEPSLNVDSKIGLQADYKFSQMFSSTVQVMTKYQSNGTYTPNIEWAFVKFKPTPNISARLGRIGAPYFMISDFRDVNYANTWVRPPLETYGNVPLSNVDGGDLTYQQTMGSANLTGQIWGGVGHKKVGDFDVKIRNQIGLVLQSEFDSGLTLRAGASRSKVSINTGTSALSAQISGLSGTVGAFEPALPGITAAYNAASGTVTNDLRETGLVGTFTGVGASWDHEDWIVAGEFTRRTLEGTLGHTLGWYASVGYRIGKITPYTYLAKASTSGLPQNPIPGFLANYGAGMTALGGGQLAGGLSYLSTNYLNAVYGGSNVNQKTIAVGARFDAWKNIALKAQWELVKPRYGAGVLSAPPGTDLTGKKINVLSVSVDFVF